MAGHLSAADFAPSAPRGGFIAPTATDSPTQRTFRASDQQTLTPVCLRMLWTAKQGPDEVFRFGDQALGQVTFVGKVVAVDTSSPTNVTYQIDDGTAAIDVKLWLEGDDAGMTQAPRTVERVNSYVRVYGHLRQWNKALNVVAFRLRVTNDCNELTFHFLEVIRVHLNHTKGPLPSLPAADSSSAVTPMKALPGAGPAPLWSPPAGPAALAAAPLPPAAYALYPPHVSELQLDVLRVIRSAPTGDLGAARRDIILALSQRWSETAVQQALSQLAADALVFSTVDDDHFKASDD